VRAHPEAQCGRGRAGHRAAGVMRAWPAPGDHPGHRPVPAPTRGRARPAAGPAGEAPGSRLRRAGPTPEVQRRLCFGNSCRQNGTTHWRNDLPSPSPPSLAAAATPAGDLAIEDHPDSAAIGARPPRRRPAAGDLSHGHDTTKAGQPCNTARACRGRLVNGTCRPGGGCGPPQASRGRRLCSLSH